MSDFRTIPQVIKYAARMAMEACREVGKATTVPLSRFERKSQWFADEARRLGSTLFVPKNYMGPTYVTTDGAMAAVRLRKEPDLYPRLGPASSDGFLLENWLTQALVEHFSTVASVLVFFGVPLAASVNDS